ncbi:MAG: S-layer homology domain-containing protein [Propionibacteriaceae bacterium]|jgi:hypothetical protein|nr:S-layer homology domain-containing protein [Propionibacteriaceae bacterium]
MLRHRLATLALAPALALTTLVTLAAPAQADDGNLVPDPDFQACINSTIGRSADAALTKDWLASINRYISCFDGNPASLDGAQYLTSATGLAIGPSHLTTLEPLSALSATLGTLYIYDNGGTRIQDLSPLSRLTGLQYLKISHAQLSNISGLSPIAHSLYNIDLANNTISDISPLSTYATTSGTLNLDNNEIVDLSVLSPSLAPRLDSESYVGLSVLDQIATWTTTAGEHDLPIKQLPGDTTKCRDFTYIFGNGDGTTTTEVHQHCALLQPLHVTVPSGVTYNETTGKITFPSSSADQTYKVTWSADYTVTVDGQAGSSTWTYFSGTLTVTVPGTGPTTPATPTTSPISTTPSTPSVPLGQVAPSYCGVTNAPVSGPVNRFLDVYADTPHAGDITWLYTAGYSIGWSVSCSHTTSTGSHLVASGAGYTLAAGNNPTGYGLFTDATYESNQGTVGYIFQPWNQVTRGDAAVWLTKLALTDQQVTLNNPASVKSFLDGKYAITNLSWAQGPDGQWGTPDDATTVTIPVGHALYREFTDITANFGAPTTDDRHGAAVTWLANTIVNASFDNKGNLTGGQRLSDGFPTGTTSEYRPLAPIARQDMAAFLYRIALYEVQTGEHPNVNLTVTKDMPGYTAHGEAVRWLAGTQITTGYPDGTFGGLLPVIRQDLAAFLHRADGVINH